MSYVGDIALGATLDIKFTTRQISGAPFTLAGAPVISAYVGNGTTEITAGITLTVDFDSRTGLNNVRVVATSGNGFATATDVQLVITTGTVNSVSVVGEVIAEFSIENRQSNVKFWNGTAVATPATAGIPDVNVKNMNNVAATPITTIKAVQGLAVDGQVTTVTGNVNGSVASVTAGVTVTTNNDKTGYTLTAAGNNAAADALLARVVTESYSVKGATRTVAQFLYEIAQKLFERSVAGTTETINKLDGVTPAMTETINNAVTPTAITRAT